MIELTIVTLIWSISFSVIGQFLAGKVDPYFSIMFRFTVALAVLLPFSSFKVLSFKLVRDFALIGMIQVGLMYIFFYHSFLFLSVPEVILFTSFTPLYVALIGEGVGLSWKTLVLVLLAVFGAIVIRWNGINSHFFIGFILVQLANISFAFGQVKYREVKRLKYPKIADRHIFVLFYFGASLIAGVAYLFWGNSLKYPSEPEQWLALLWLGFVASGLGYLFWNKGATKVSVRTLAIMNNAIVPVAIFVNLFWGGDIKNVSQFSMGSMLILLSLLLNNETVLFKKLSKVRRI